MVKQLNIKHYVERTSPKGLGQKFIGKCILCGAENLPANAVLENCSNTRNLTKIEALTEIIDGTNNEK